MAPDPVLAARLLPAQLTASSPAFHIFFGFCIFPLLNVQIGVGTLAGIFFPTVISEINQL